MHRRRECCQRDEAQHLPATLIISLFTRKHRRSLWWSVKNVARTANDQFRRKRRRGTACADASAWSSCHTFMSLPQAWPNQSSIALFCLDSLRVKIAELEQPRRYAKAFGTTSTCCLGPLRASRVLAP